MVHSFFSICIYKKYRGGLTYVPFFTLNYISISYPLLSLHISSLKFLKNLYFMFSLLILRYFSLNKEKMELN